MVCYDPRAAANHAITLEVTRDTQAAQDAVNRELVSRYRPGQPRVGPSCKLPSAFIDFRISPSEIGIAGIEA